jgi:DEAD/DEAH box helicase domain-containing protein
MDTAAFLDELRSAKDYAGQIVYVRRVDAQPARYASPSSPLRPELARMLASRGITRLYSHQAEALDALAGGRDVLLATGTASGKSLCYILPILDCLLTEPGARALLLFPTKALSQDQFRTFRMSLEAAGMDDVLAGVYDGDTPGDLRRKLRDRGSVIFSNPDMLHAAVLPQHGRWADFLANLRFLVLDEMHVYNGIFGSNMANLLRRFERLCGHYGSGPRWIGCSATLANPRELAQRLTGRAMHVVEDDGSPRGARTYVFWNPPRIRRGDWHSRRSANVEAHELMAELVRRSIPTITFSKSKMTAEMIHRYVRETLARVSPGMTDKVTPYRGGYRPEERREIEKRLFGGDLIGVSATRALELGIDVGPLEASIIVGYPGTLTSFFQQAGRAGRRDRDALVILVGLDTAVNQYVLTNPDYLFARPIEQAILDADNPFVAIGHLRCATHELPLADGEVSRFGTHAPMVLKVLGENRKVHHAKGHWYHAAAETPQHEISLRDTAGANVVIQDADTGEAIGEVNRFDAPPILHPEAVYMHLGQTYVVLSLDLEKNIAVVKKVDVDYYTNPLGGTDVHHVDHRLREKPFGTGKACWGEVTSYFHTGAYQKIHFYTLDVVSVHRVDLPTMQLETMALWLVPPEPLLERVRQAGLDVHAGLRGIGYATRMLLPLFMTCDTLDFSHSIGSVNSEWQAIFIYERYPHGLGFTEKSYERLHDIIPAVLERIRQCSCDDGCPCCVGKPLRQYATWYVDLGEASIPSKSAARRILEGLLGRGDLVAPDAEGLTDSDESDALRLEQALRRRLERMREPQLFHPIAPTIPTGYPEPEKPEALDAPDVAVRRDRRTSFVKELRRRLAKQINDGTLAAETHLPGPPPGMRTLAGNAPPTDFPGIPDVPAEEVTDEKRPQSQPIQMGDSLAARALRLKRSRRKQQD